MSEITRKLATVRKIAALTPIPDADKIEVATVDGWNVVCQKGLYEVGDLATYFEIDSFIPTAIAPFLTKDGHFPKTFEGVEGERLKTVRLRKQLSQGLLIPLAEIVRVVSSFGGVDELEEGMDLTEVLGILKWEAPISAQLAGTVKGNFPTAVPKTDQERIQNLTRAFEQWKEKDYTWTVTEKLEGSSDTMYLPLNPEDPFEVCSRNLSLKESETNTFWAVAKRYDVEARMRDLGMYGIALQGELIGEGIQGNIYGLKGQDVRIYHVYDVKAGKNLPLGDRLAICDKLGLPHVPVINPSLRLSRTDTIKFLLEYAEGASQLNAKQEREGLVFECNEDTDISWKAISNKYLEKQK